MPESLAAGLPRAIERAGLVLPPGLTDQIATVLDAGQHVVFTGGPGTGKTSLAVAVAEAGREALRCTGYLPVTASVDWTPADTVGAMAPGPAGPVFRPGVLVEAIEAGRWVVLDEIDRLDPLRALGPLSTVLAGQPAVLPYRQAGEAAHLSLVPPGRPVPPGTHPIRVPAAWRIIATANGPLNRASGGPPMVTGALARRFAFIEVPCPSASEYNALVAGPGEIVADLLPLRLDQPLGPAVFLSAARYAGRRARTSPSRSRLLLEVFGGYVLPHFEDVDGPTAGRLLDLLRPLLDRDDVAEAAAMLSTRTRR
jgi:hypothetical protein